jgi:hypothetical protein
MLRFSFAVPLLLVIALSSALAVSCVHKGHNWGDDFAQYIEQARAISNHSLDSYLEINRYAMDHSDPASGPYLCPNGFPLLILPIYKLFGLNMVALKVWCTLFFLGSLFLLSFALRNRLATGTQVVVLVAVIGLHPDFVSFSDQILSDFPFLFFSLLSIVLIESGGSYASRVAAGLCICVAYMVRDVGVLLLPVLLIYQWKNGDWRKHTFRSAAAWIAFGAGLGLYKLALTGNSSQQVNALRQTSLSTITHNLGYYFGLVCDFFSYSYLPKYLVALPLFGLMLIGMYKKRSDDLHIIVYVVLVVSIYILWPSRQGIRYLFPIMPFLVYFLMTGILAIIPNRKVFRYAGYVLLAMYLSVGVGKAVQFSHAQTDAVTTPEMESIYAYIDGNIPSDQIIIFYKPRALRLFTGRNSIRVKDDRLTSSGPSYLLDSNVTARFANDPRFAVIFRTHGYLLYKITS